MQPSTSVQKPPVDTAVPPAATDNKAVVVDTGLNMTVYKVALGILLGAAVAGVAAAGVLVFLAGGVVVTPMLIAALATAFVALAAHAILSYVAMSKQANRIEELEAQVKKLGGTVAAEPTTSTASTPSSTTPAPAPQPGQQPGAPAPTATQPGASANPSTSPSTGAKQNPSAADPAEELKKKLAARRQMNGEVDSSGAGSAQPSTAPGGASPASGASQSPRGASQPSGAPANPPPAGQPARPVDLFAQINQGGFKLRPTQTKETIDPALVKKV